MLMPRGDGDGKWRAGCETEVTDRKRRQRGTRLTHAASPAKRVSSTDAKRLEEITRQISPVYHVTTDDPPTLIIHGDKDPLVPLQQSEMIVEKLKKAGVETELVMKPGAG